MKRTRLIVAAGLALCLSASAGIVAQWDFNSIPPDTDLGTGTYSPAIGTGLGSTVGTTTGVAFLDGAGSSDPAASDNSCLKLASFPGAQSGNKTKGAQFALDTTGYQNLTMTWDQLNMGSASKYWRIQYSTDGGATWVDKEVIVNSIGGGNWVNSIATVSFVSVPAANNNPNFMVRLVSEWQSTATGTGFAGFIGILNTYSVNGTLKLDMVTFSGTAYSDNVSILADPTNQVVSLGQPASFSVVAGGGTTPITYQWRKNTALLTDATNAVYSIAAAQTADAGSYDVIVANGVNSQTSAVATLAVRGSAGLAWTGQNGAAWDTSSLNWQDTNSLASVAYTSGDHVLFDSRGAAAPAVNLTASLTPSSVTVNADFDYTLGSDVGGKLEGATGLTKRGSGTLILDTDNTYSGPTVIEAGVLQLGLADAYGLAGSGPIINNGALVLNRTNIFTLTNVITSSGSLTNFSKSVTLAAGNTYSGPIAAKAGSLLLMGNQTINSTDIFVSASAATGPTGATKFGLADGGVVGAGTTVHLTGSTAAPDCRCTLWADSGTNRIDGPIVLEGSGNNGIQCERTHAQFFVNGNVTGLNFEGGSLTLRGGYGSGILNGTINLPGHAVHKADGGTWIINSTGNAWGFTSFADGTLRLGTNNALPTALTMSMGGAGGTKPNQPNLDLGGFDQEIAALVDGGGIETIGNSSAVSDSTLTVGYGTFSGTIQNTLPDGSRKVSLVVKGPGSFTLAGFNTYSGDTTVLGGTLALSGVGDIAASPVINLAGGSLDVSNRFDGTLAVYPGQTLKGNGTLGVAGNLTHSGYVELKVNKAGGIVSHDKLAVTGQLTCGGNLKLELTGEALNSRDILQVFEAGSYGGSLPVIEPAVPAPGATWDTSTLLTDGKLRIYGPPMFNSPVLSATGITLSGIGGEALGTFSVLTATNVAAPAAEWTPVQTGSFDASGNFSVTLPITLGQPQQFYKLQMP